MKTSLLLFRCLMALTFTVTTAELAHAAGGPGYALWFNDTADSISVPHAGALNAFPFTVTAWVQATLIGPNAASINLVSKYGSINGWQFSLSGGNLYAAYYANGSNFVPQLDGGPVADGAWHHLAFTVDGNGGRLYVDGMLQASNGWTGTASSATTTENMRLGGFAGPLRTLNVTLDEVTVWNVALSPPQIQANMNRSLTGNEAGLVAYYRCDEGTGPTMADSAPAGGPNNGSLSGPAFISSGIFPFTPFVETVGAGSIGPARATLLGVANPESPNASVWFEWGTTANYGNSTPAQPVGGAANLNFAHDLTNLATGVAYQFRAVASNSFGISFGANRSFTTFPRLYFENFDDDHTGNWIVNSGPGANAADFFFDYSTVGIPPAPHSAGTTRGMKLEADYAGNVLGGLSVSPRGQHFTGDYVLTFDIWWNFVGPAPAGGSGSTQVTGAGIDTEGITPQWGGGTNDSVFFGVTGDGGSITDYRAYSFGQSGVYPSGSSVYAAPSGAVDSSAPYYAAFGGNTPPAGQTALFPQQTGTTTPGAPAFRWHIGSIIKVGNQVTFRVNELVIARFDNWLPPLVKNISFNQFDVNATSSTDPNVRSLEFGLIDNVMVSRLGEAPLLSGDLNADGLVDQAELNTVLGRYFATSPWLLMTNMAGLGGTSVTFALTNSTTGAFSVEYTTNLVNWQFLGPATPRYEFTDTNAPAVPQRYYRLRWP